MCSLLASGSLAVHATPTTQTQFETRYDSYMVRQVTALVAKVAKLTDAIMAGNMAARQPYKRIETLADAWPALDSDIDSRINGVPKGKWYSFHVFEQAVLTTRGSGPGLLG